MNLPNRKYLDSLIGPGCCELCGKPCKTLCGAHAYSRGAGTIDHPINTVRVGANPTNGDCSCHVASHTANGADWLVRMKKAIAKREGLHPEVVKDTVDAIRAVPAKLSLEQIEMWLDGHVGRKNVAELAFAICVDWFREFKPDEYERWAKSNEEATYECWLHRNS